jgi:hypothetical protein
MLKTGGSIMIVIKQKRHIIFLVGSIIFVCVFLSACSTLLVQRVKTETEIFRDLQNTDISTSVGRIAFQDGSLYGLRTVTIEKRQTNKNEKSDSIYCQLHFSNDEKNYYCYYALLYQYYDKGGWILENYEIYDYDRERYEPLFTVEEDKISGFLNSFFPNNDYLTYEVIQRIPDLTNGTETITTKINHNAPLKESSGSVSFTLEFNKYSWELDKSSLIKHSDYTEEWLINGTKWKYEDKSTMDKIEILDFTGETISFIYDYKRVSTTPFGSNTSLSNTFNYDVNHYSIDDKLIIKESSIAVQCMLWDSKNSGNYKHRSFIIKPDGVFFYNVPLGGPYTIGEKFTQIVE